MEKPRYQVRIDVSITDTNFSGGGQLRLSEESTADIGGVEEAARLLTAVAAMFASVKQERK
jgi:hypothetical protein